jgi:3-keto-disaccharide hydrolase
MKTNKMKFVPCVLITSLLFGCGPGQMFGPTLTPTLTPSSMPTSTPIPTSTLTLTPTQTLSPTPTLVPTLTPFPTIVFQDDFSNTSSGWAAGKGNVGWVSYDGGSYVVNGTTQGALFWGGLKKKTFRDLVIDVDVTWVDPPTSSSAFGVGCRSAYDFVIGVDGGVFIFLDQKGKFESLAEQSLSRADISLNRTGLNRVRIICDKDRLALYLNNNFVLQVSDKTVSQGQVFLGASGAKVSFDNVRISAP